MSTRIGGPPHRRGGLVGRRVELAWLRSRLAGALEGDAQLVLVEGDAGMGKTRLANELVEEARRTGARIVRGRCYEHLRYAYLPLRESLFAELADWAAGGGAGDADLGDLTALDGASGHADASPAEPGDPGAGARQLLALTRAIIEYCRGQPTVLFLDDLQWADDATTDLLRHLLFRFEDAEVPLLVLATARIDARAPGAGGIERIRGETRAVALTVHPLSVLEATELAREVSGELPLEQARVLAAASGGNPLLVEALARHAASGPGVGPLTVARGAHPVTAAIAAELERMSPAARAITRAAAVLVPACPTALLLEVADLGPEAGATALDEVIDALVLVDLGDTVDFFHPLFAHLAYEDMSAAQRRSVHARAARVLLDGADAPDVGAVARHLVGAGPSADPAEVARYARLAGDTALAAAAWADAATFYEAVIAADDADDAERARLHRLAGLSRRGNLELGRAVDHFDAAIGLLGPGGDPHLLLDLATWRLRCAVGSHELLDAVADPEPLEALLPQVDHDDPAAAAEALVELSQAYWINGDIARSEAAARRAIDLAGSTGNTLAAARGAMSLAVPQWARYDLAESLQSLHDATEAHPSSGGGADRAGGPRFRIPLVLAWLGRLDDAERAAAECLEIAEHVDYPLEVGLPLAALSLVALVRGDFDRVELLADRALVVQRLSGYHWAAGLYLPALAQARLARDAFDLADEAYTTWSETAGRAEQLTIELLRRHLAAMQRDLPVAGDPLLPLPRSPAVGADTWTAITLETARCEGLTIDARAAHDLLAEMERRGGVVVSGTGMLIARLRGVAADLMGDEDGAIAGLVRAQETAEHLGARPERARTLVDLAAIRLRRSERAEATAMLDDAIDELETLGMFAEARRAARATGDRDRGRPTGPASPEPVTSHAVVLFTDVVGSTRLTEELGNTRYRDRARRLERLVASTVAAHHGTVVTGINLGDGLIGLFREPEHATRAALACAAEAERVADLHLRIGIHEGEILVDGSRIYGGPVNYAARVCSLAAQDEVLVSRAVRDGASREPTLAFVDRGTHALKGIAGAQPLFAAVPAETTTPAASV